MSESKPKIWTDIDINDHVQRFIDCPLFVELQEYNALKEERDTLLKWKKEMTVITQDIFSFKHPDLKLGESKVKALLKFVKQRDEALKICEELAGAYEKALSQIEELIGYDIMPDEKAALRRPGQAQRGRGKMSKVINIDDFRKGEYLFAALAMCVSCHNRWVAGVPKDTSLFKLECPSCHDQNSFASILPSEYLGEFGI